MNTGTTNQNAEWSPAPLEIDVVAWRRAIREDTFARYHYQMGVALTASGAPSAAAAAFRRAIETKPDLVEAHLRLIDLLSRNGETDQAAIVEAAAASIFPAFPARARVLILVEDFRAGRVDSGTVEAGLRAVAAASPGVIEARLWLDLLLLDRGEPATAPLTAETASALDGERARLLAEEHQASAKRALAAGKTASSREMFGRSVLLDDRLADSHYELGRFLVGERRFVEAEGYFRRAVAIDRSHGDFFANLGIALMGLARHDEALEELERAAALSPEESWILGFYGVALQAAGRFKEAAEQFERTIAAKSASFWMYGHLGLARQALGHREEARVAYLEAIRQVPDMAWPRAAFGLWLFAEGRFADALACQRAALALEPAEPWSLMCLALNLEGEPREVETLLRRAATADRDWIRHYARLLPGAEARFATAFGALGLKPIAVA